MLGLAEMCDCFTITSSDVNFMNKLEEVAVRISRLNSLHNHA